MAPLDKPDPLLECLLVLCRYHDKVSSKDALLAGLPTQNALNPSLFVRAADRAGFASKVVSETLETIPEHTLPAILLLDGEQACVLMSWNRDKTLAQLVYPQMPETVVGVKAEELNGSYCGVVIYSQPRFFFDARGSNTHQQKFAHWFWGPMLKNIGLYRDVLLAAFFINTFALALPLYTMNVYDRVVPNHALETLWMFALGIGIVLCADLLLRTMRAYFIDLASKRVDLLLSMRLMQQVLGLKMEDKPISVGAFAANLRSYETVRDFITSASLTALIDLPFTFLFMFVLWWIGGPMLYILLAGVLVVVSYSYFTQRRMKALSEQTYEASAMRNAILIESLMGLEALKVMSAEGSMQRSWERSAAFINRIGMKLRMLASSNTHVAQWAQQGVSIGIIVMGVYLIIDGELTMGGLIAATMLCNRAMAPLGQVAALLSQFHNAKAAFTMLDGLMQKPLERPLDSQFLSHPHVKGAVEFKQVSFRYPGAQMDSLVNINLRIEEGEHVAILGRVGSGKTTLQKMILNLYTPSQGSVLVDGIDVRQLDPAELRRNIGYVAQDVTLFFGTLRDNICFACPGASDEQVNAAAEFAGLGDFVHQHPQGLDMNIGERGECLSGGQRRAVSIARSVIHNPRLLLFDEVTASLDNASEAAFKEQVSRYAKNKTMIVVTHRPSVLPLVNRIIVMDSGQVVADGPRDQVVDALRSGRIGKAK